MKGKAPLIPVAVQTSVGKIMMAKKAAVKSNVIVTINDSHVDQMETVSAALKKAGLSIGQVLSTGGIVTGQVAASKMQSLRQVDGVKDVEPDGEMHAI